MKAYIILHSRHSGHRSIDSKQDISIFIFFVVLCPLMRVFNQRCVTYSIPVLWDEDIKKQPSDIRTLYRLIDFFKTLFPNLKAIMRSAMADFFVRLVQIAISVLLAWSTGRNLILFDWTEIRNLQKFNLIFFWEIQMHIAWRCNCFNKTDKMVLIRVSVKRKQIYSSSHDQIETPNQLRLVCYIQGNFVSQKIIKKDVDILIVYWATTEVFRLMKTYLKEWFGTLVKL